MASLQNDYNHQQLELKNWKSSIYDDFKTFVKNYDSEFKSFKLESTNKNQEFLETFDKLRKVTDRNKENIQLVAKESLRNHEDYQEQIAKMSKI